MNKRPKRRGARLPKSGPKKAKTGVSIGPPLGVSPAWTKMVEKGRARKRTGAGRSGSQGTGPGLDWPEPDGEPVGALHRPRFARSTYSKRAERILALKNKTLVPLNDSRLVQSHVEHRCPMCIAPDYTKTQGWPEPCQVLVAPNVVCSDTQSAEHIGHHHDCTFWDHTDAVPF